MVLCDLSWKKKSGVMSFNVGKTPELIRDRNLMRSWSRTMRTKGKTIALVPTMGYLHQGHISLVEEAKKHAQLVVVSIYINPGQFSPSEDLSTYPSDFEGDLRKLEEREVDVVFHPSNLYDYTNPREKQSGSVKDLNFDINENKDLGIVKEDQILSGSLENVKRVVSCVEEKGNGRSGHETWVSVERLQKGLCGNSRPIFFRGVATIVCKLFNIVEPDVAIFGKKDYQQWRLIRRMVRDLDFGINVIGSEIVRDTDGLAMSSRNVHLSLEEREKSLSISRSLSSARVSVQNGEICCKKLRNSVIEAISGAGGRIDYVEVVDQESLEKVEEIKQPVVFCVAAWFGKVRLIDNMEINL